jgi:hypothetical protein
MQRISAFLWIAAAGAVLQLVSLGSNFYETTGNKAQVKSAWFGIPHTSDLILASALVAIAAVGLTAADRQPVRGRTLGLIVGGIGLLATAQLVYRMITPPFGGCLQYGCGTSPAQDVNLLVGIWIALGGCIAVTIGGLLHAFASGARHAAARPWIAADQPGMSPWLGLSALGAVAMFVFPFTAFTLYTVSGFFGQQGTTTWGGWLSLPHTSSVVLAITLIVVGLAIAAARRRSPLPPAALGATVAILSFAAAARIFYRILEDPFGTAGGAESVQVGSVQVELAGYLGLAAAIVAVIGGVVHAAQHREPSSERRRSVEPVAGT